MRLCINMSVNAAACAGFNNWSKELELSFLECLQGEPLLWQAKHIAHRNKNMTHDAWSRISSQLNVPIADLKKKKESLMSSFRTYRKKVRDTLQSGAGREDVYKPIWFAYELMDSFLGDSSTCQETINTEKPSSPVNTHEEEEEEIDGMLKKPVRITTRKHKLMSEVEDSGKLVKDALSTLKSTLNTPKSNVNTEEDECDWHGKIIAKRLRQIPENERIQFVCQIYDLFVQRESLIQSPANLAYSAPSPVYYNTQYYNTSVPELIIPENQPTATNSKIIITSNQVIRTPRDFDHDYNNTDKDCKESIF